jgi:hypothetical protein
MDGLLDVGDDSIARFLRAWYGEPLKRLPPLPQPTRMNQSTRRTAGLSTSAARTLAASAAVRSPSRLRCR